MVVQQQPLPDPELAAVEADFQDFVKDTLKLLEKLEMGCSDTEQL